MRIDQLETEFFVEVARSCPFGILALDEAGRIQFLNAAAADLLGASEEKLIGTLVSKSLPGIESGVGQDWANLKLHLAEDRVAELECRRRFVAGSQNRWTVLYLEDAQRSTRRELILEQEATTDELSGLANRRGFQRKLESNLSEKLALAIIDIDRFKQVNDQFGHVAGDDVIRLLGVRIRDLFADLCLIAARTGGDEFGILCRSTDAPAMLEKLEALRTLFENEKQSVAQASVSIGVVISQISGLGSRELLTRADSCLYEAKDAGRNCLRQITCDPPA